MIKLNHCSEPEAIEERRKELKNKIDATKDYFLIYGYVKELEELDRIPVSASGQTGT